MTSQMSPQPSSSHTQENLSEEPMARTDPIVDSIADRILQLSNEQAAIEAQLRSLHKQKEALPKSPESLTLQMNQLTQSMNDFIGVISDRLHLLEDKLGLNSSTSVLSTPLTTVPTTTPVQSLSSLALPADTELRSIRASQPKPFGGIRKELDGFLFQMENYFTLQNIKNSAQKLASLSLSLEGSALEWFKANQRSYRTWEEVKEALQAYYGDHYRADKAYKKILQLKQIGSVQDYLSNLDRLNTYAQISDLQLIQIILMALKPDVRSSMAHYEHLRSNPIEWRRKLVEMDVADSQLKELSTTIPHDRKRPATAISTIHSRTERPLVPHQSTWISDDIIKKRKSEGRCTKCGRSGHMIRECRSSNYRSTPEPSTSHNNTSTISPATKKPRVDTGHLKLVDYDSDSSEEENTHPIEEVESENE